MKPIPPRFTELDTEALCDAIRTAKTDLGKDLVILGHHYQRDEVIQFADIRGDSLKLSQFAAEQRDARHIVFCGVHFMAESADVLSDASQTVYLPNLGAGCAMADMADDDAVAAAIEEVGELAGEATVVPITYVNSAAVTKALTAKAGGACCTSSNVRNVFEWALRRADQGGAGGRKVLAIPDEHLATNTAADMGYDQPGDVVIYEPHKPAGGLTAEQVAAANVICWKGYCHVHQVFTPQAIDDIRAAEPDVTVIVHPECPRAVVARADLAGSTSQIINAIADAPAGSSWAVGTEGNLVRRLAAQNPDKDIRVLGDRPAACWQMAMIDLPYLLWTLTAILEGEPVNEVHVDSAVADDARLALQRMIDIKAVEGPSGK
ncbi:MAG: quinolinate synthase NadA [Planctomycetes bacterium]|jgi:quinolinate synthase|nr:quinolinate synthase NadA [Phycisphaerae bacterium]NBB96505.1 quinolinate synthase NadA [Planctomycetota bacterium]